MTKHNIKKSINKNTVISKLKMKNRIILSIVPEKAFDEIQQPSLIKL